MRNRNHSIAALLVAQALSGQCFAATDMPPAAAQATPETPVRTPAPYRAPLKPCSSVEVEPPTQVLLGKSTVVKLSRPAARMVVGGASSARAGKPVDGSDPRAAAAAAAPAAAPAAGGDSVADVDVILLSPTELFFVGKKAGSMNVVLQGADGRCVVKDLIVTIDPDTLQAKLAELMPEETGIRVRGAENALVLTGKVSDAARLDDVMSLATSYGDGKKVINLMRVTAQQQVMLEVKIAEVSKNLLDRIGASLSVGRTSNGGNNNSSLFTNFLTNGNALLRLLHIGGTVVTANVDGQKDDGVVRVLAEPNVMAISGQQASFLSGGKIFIPVAQVANGALGGTTVTLEEKEFGIGVKFLPTVLDGTRINLKLVSEVSDLSQTGSPFTTVGGVTAVLPSLTVRRADTTVQLNDGQSFVIAGLIKNNTSESVKRFPGLGEVPVLGALFRSSEFQKDQTELVFVVTPHLVKPLNEAPRLPTDNMTVPSRTGRYLNGSLEGPTPSSSAGDDK